MKLMCNCYNRIGKTQISLHKKEPSLGTEECDKGVENTAQSVKEGPEDGICIMMRPI
jgi:hypothetical protein